MVPSARDYTSLSREYEYRLRLVHFVRKLRNFVGLLSNRASGISASYYLESNTNISLKCPQSLQLWFLF